MMTEAEWHTSTHPSEMLKFVGRIVGERKLRIYAAACCQRVRHLLENRPALEACDALERSIDGGLLTRSMLDDWFWKVQAAWKRRLDDPADFLERAACQAVLDSLAPTLVGDDFHTHSEVIKAVALATGDVAGGPRWVAAAVDESRELSGLLREIVGSPFRPAAVPRGCVTGEMAALAREIYEGQAFHRMPELADALETAGCDDAEVLGHLRGQGGHVRGCWVVDLLLGKT